MRSHNLRPEPDTFPAGQRLAAKLGAAAQALIGLGLRIGLGPIAEAAPRIHSRLNALAASSGGQGPDALDRLAAAWNLSREDQLRFLVAALPAIDAEIAGLVAEIEGDGLPLVSVETLMALFPGRDTTLWAQRLGCDDPFLASGLLVLSPRDALLRHRLGAGDGVWPGLLDLPLWPSAIAPAGIEALALQPPDSPDHRLALAALAQGEPVLIAALDDTPDAALERAVALCVAAQRRFAVFDLDEPAAGKAALILGHALLRGCCPILVMPRSGFATLPGARLYPAPVLVAGRDLASLRPGERSLLSLPASDQSPPDQTAVWQGALPAIAPGDIADFCARYSFGPVSAMVVLRDAGCRARLGGRPIALTDLLSAARARSTTVHLSGAVRRPARASLPDLVLPPAALAELRAAALRQKHHATVARMLPAHSLPLGQRLLFSGGSGTGKTLAAEALANEAGTGLIVADTPRLLSKWLGESEQNLAELFRIAEDTRSLLFFDEADASFGKRFEAKEARDHYANIGTAYLLQRIERFSGIVVLATNLPGNLDDAFRRRFDAIIEFPQPDTAGRAELWRRHLPADLLGDGQFDPGPLAEWYRLPGGLIRNAAICAAYLAAADGGQMRPAHIYKAIAREYQKNGKPFPGLPGDSQMTAEEEIRHA